MIMLRCVVDPEYNGNLRIEKLDAEFGEVVLRIEDQTVGATGKRLFDQKERFDPAIFVSPRMTKLGPGLIRVLDVQMNSDASSRRAARYVEYMRGDGAHLETAV